MGLVSGCTLCDRLPAQPDWPSGDCVAVVHGLGQRMVSKVMGMRWVQRSSGAVYDWFVWVLQERGWRGQLLWLHQDSEGVVSLAELQHTSWVMVEFAWQQRLSYA